jgi:hypothetical protein
MYLAVELGAVVIWAHGTSWALLIATSTRDKDRRAFIVDFDIFQVPNILALKNPEL